MGEFSSSLPFRLRGEKDGVLTESCVYMRADLLRSRRILPIHSEWTLSLRLLRLLVLRGVWTREMIRRGRGRLGSDGKDAVRSLCRIDSNSLSLSLVFSPRSIDSVMYATSLQSYDEFERACEAESCLYCDGSRFSSSVQKISCYFSLVDLYKVARETSIPPFRFGLLSHAELLLASPLPLPPSPPSTSPFTPLLPTMSTSTSSTSIIEGPHSCQFFTKTWSPSSEPRAAVLFVHGFVEHVVRYDHVFASFADQGIAVFAYDQRGEFELY